MYSLLLIIKIPSFFNLFLFFFFMHLFYSFFAMYHSHQTHKRSILHLLRERLRVRRRFHLLVHMNQHQSQLVWHHVATTPALQLWGSIATAPALPNEPFCLQAGLAPPHHNFTAGAAAVPSDRLKSQLAQRPVYLLDYFLGLDF